MRITSTTALITMLIYIFAGPAAAGLKHTKGSYSIREVRCTGCSRSIFDARTSTICYDCKEKGREDEEERKKEKKLQKERERENKGKKCN